MDGRRRPALGLGSRLAGRALGANGRDLCGIGGSWPKRRRLVGGRRVQHQQHQHLVGRRQLFLTGAVYRTRAAVEGADDQVYAIGGSTGPVSSSEVDAYNPVSNTWTTMPSLPLDRQGLGAAALPDGHILAISGLNSETNTYETEVDSLNVANYSATASGSLTVTAAAVSLTALAPITVAAGQTPTNILVGVVTGLPLEVADDRFSAQVSWGDGSTSDVGLSFSGPNLSLCYIYATKPSPYLVGGQYSITVSLAAGESVNVWDSGQPRPALPTFREGLAVATSSTGLVYAAGGSDATNTPSAEVDVYNPTNFAWSTVAPLPLARTRLTLAPLPGGDMLAIGGQDPSGQTDAEVDLYNPTTNTWSPAAPLPDPRFAAATAVGPDGTVYVIGGRDVNRNATAEVDAYNPSTNTWSVVASLPTARAAPAASVGPDGKIYVFGGIDSTGNYLSDTLVYTPASNSWTQSTPMPVAANQRSAALGADGLIHVVGGFTPKTGSLSAVDTFNTATGVWTTVNPLPTPRSLAGAAVTPAGTLLVVGGQNQSLSAGTTTLVPQIDFTATAAQLFVMGSSSATVTSAVTNLTVVSPTVTAGQTASGDTVATFTPNIAGATPGTYSAYLTWGDGTIGSASVIADPSVSGQYDVVAGNNSPVLGVTGPAKFSVTVFLTSNPPIAPPVWVPGLAFLPAPLGGIRTSAAVDSTTGLVYVLGGNNPSAGGAQSTVEVFNPASNTWSPGTPLPDARYRVAAVSDGIGLIYAIGGQDSSGNTYSEVDVFQPDKNRLTQAAPLPIPLSGPAAVLGPDGRIYVFGGQDSTGAPTADVEAYDQWTNTWTILASLPTARSFLAGAVGSDGRIYAIGGQDASGNPSGEVDAYNFLTNTWTVVASLSTPRTGVTATEGVDGRIYAIGGALVGGATTAETDVYNPATNTWTTIANLPLDRQGLGSVSLGNGLLLAIGGNSTTAGGAVSEVDMLAVTDPALTASGSVNVVPGIVATTTALTASVNPTYLGQPVTFTAVVAPLPPGLPAPTGSVTFYDNGTSFADHRRSHGSGDSELLYQHPRLGRPPGLGGLQRRRERPHEHLARCESGGESR